MSFQFRPAKREGVHIIIGLMGGTGSGKTWSALEIATGLAQGKPFAFIDTEAGKAKHYADYFDFQHGDLSEPFNPNSYLEAILAAEKASFPVVVVDSFSHEHAGPGGILDMHDKEYKRLGSREAIKMLAWVKPKTEHKRMVSKLLQLRIHLVLCFRAEPKVKPMKINGKTEIVDLGWQPICAKGLEFEMTASFMLNHEKPGHVVAGEIERKAAEAGLGTALKVPEPLKSVFSGSFILSRKHGEAVAKWAKGGSETQKAGNGAILKKIGAEFKGRLSRKEIWEGLEDADLKDPGCDLPPSTPWPKVKAALDKAIEAKAERALKAPEVNP